MNNIVLVWAWWTWMFGVAWLLHDLWFTNIVCIDSTQSELTDKLQTKWLDVIIGHWKYQVQLWDIVIYSEAALDSEEVVNAKELYRQNQKIWFVMDYFPFLGEVSKYFQTIWFAWTNGKSSSTALAIYTAEKLLPNWWIGILWSLVADFDNQTYTFNHKIKSDLKNIFDFILTGKNLNYDNVKKYLFFVESCEWRRHFLNLDLDDVVITNLELDHIDYYKDWDDYLLAFKQLVEKVKNKIFVPEWTIISQLWIDKNSKKLVEVKIKKIDFDHILGEHNNLNWSLVLSVIKKITEDKKRITEDNRKITNDGIVNVMKRFKWLRRRLELLKRTSNGAIIYSDYGHMASSIKIWYKTIKEKYPNKKIYAIFQPHQINRIALWWNDFIDAFQHYSDVIIYDIYAARENIHDFKFWALSDRLEIKNLEDLWNEFARVCGWRYVTNIEDIQSFINKMDKNSVIIIFTAGDLDYKIR